MEADRTEQHNVIAEHSEIGKKMAAAWKKWAETSFVDEWTGPDHTNWGDDIKDAPKKK